MIAFLITTIVVRIRKFMIQKFNAISTLSNCILQIMLEPFFLDIPPPLMRKALMRFLIILLMR